MTSYDNIYVIDILYVILYAGIIISIKVVDAELQAGALKRRLALLEEETARVKVCILFNLNWFCSNLWPLILHVDQYFFKERLQENVEKCKTIETSGQENEDARKAGEARSFAAEVCFYLI